MNFPDKEIWHIIISHRFGESHKVWGQKKLFKIFVYFEKAILFAAGPVIIFLGIYLWAKWSWFQHEDDQGNL